MTDLRQFAAATSRNREPILNTLRSLLPNDGTVLEIASGTGEHAAYFTSELPHLTWQPSNFEEAHLTSTEAWRSHTGLSNFKSVVKLDASSDHWPVEAPDYAHAPIRAIYNANMIHISPWFVTEGLFRGAGRILPAGAKVFLYGPYKINGQHTAQSNHEFETWLKAKDESFAVRDIADVSQEALKNGLKHLQSIPMPSNNFIQVFEKSAE